VHADATQAAAWDSLSFGSLPVTSLALAPHKFGGPRGIGGLLVRGGIGVAPLTPGPQELGLRGGTEAVALAVGFAASLELATAAREAVRRQVTELRDRFEAAVCAAVPDAVVNAAGAERLWNTTNIGFPGLEAEAILLLLSERGIAASAGAAISMDPASARNPL
jgi:cysteine desulfurase